MSGLQAVLSALPDARFVGGCVRDSIAGLPIADIDLATPTPPPAVVQALTAAGLRSIPSGIAHGTVTALSEGSAFEITTLRADVSTDGRHAVVAFTDDWRADAARRDFTINALSMTPHAVVYDYFDGIADLRAGRLRFVGDPATRLAEDRLRVLRFFRFYARYATAAPGCAVEAALQEQAGALHLLSPERVWAELKRILAASDPRSALMLMRKLTVLMAVLPQAGSLEPLERLIQHGAPADPLLRLAALVKGDTAALAARLRLSGAEADRLAALHTGPVPHPEATDDDLRRLLAGTPASLLSDRTWLSGYPQALRDRLCSLPLPVFPLTGADLQARGIAPGPGLGAMLLSVRCWWLTGGCRADRDACLGRLGIAPAA